jgi:hypothetical protein
MAAMNFATRTRLVLAAAVLGAVYFYLLVFLIGLTSTRLWPAWWYVSFRQGCVVRRLGTGRMGLGGWIRAGVVLREGGLVVPGHPVGRIRGDGRGVAL